MKLFSIGCAFVLSVSLLACGSGGGGVETGPDAVQQDQFIKQDLLSGDLTPTDNPTPSDSGGTDGTTPTDIPGNPETADPGAYDLPGMDTSTPDPKCQTLKEGTVTGFDVDGTARTFILNLPKGVDNGGPWPVIFNWHGFGDTASNMAHLLSNQVSNHDYPFILVTPEDTNMQPTKGMDWDILKISKPNKEARLFDEVLKCLDQRYGVDWDGIHSVGFSAGSIMTDLLGVLRGDMMASIATYSGVYFSNQPNVDALGSLASFVSWPQMTTTNTYAQLLVHGGQQDNYNMMVTTLQFDESGKRDVTWLSGMGHDVIHCTHSGGHTIPSSFNDGGGKLVEFFKAHRRGGGASTWSAGLPADYPKYCTFVAGK